MGLVHMDIPTSKENIMALATTKAKVALTLAGVIGLGTVTAMSASAAVPTSNTHAKPAVHQTMKTEAADPAGAEATSTVDPAGGPDNNVQSGDQTGADVGGTDTKAEAKTPESSSEVASSESAKSESDGPGGYADPAGNNVQSQGGVQN